MTVQGTDMVPEGFGWFYYRKGRAFGITKNHYLPKGKLQTLCGNHNVNPNDTPYVRFTDTDQLFKNKVCKSCLNLLNTKSLVTC
jgi:hypothetical protein